MDAHGYRKCVPELTDPSVTEEPLLDFTSGYVLRSLDQLPKQGSKEPWKLRQNYVLDLRTIRRGPIEDGAMQFSPARAAREPARPSLALRAKRRSPAELCERARPTTPTCAPSSSTAR